MPILVRDPWRKQFFDHVFCHEDVIVPIDDMDAWALYPAERHIYDRLFVASVQGLAAGPHGTTPPFFPVFSKPIINLKGMGIGSRVITTTHDYDHGYQAGHFWMPVLDGPHVSTDCVIRQGRILWARHATGEVFRDGMFRYWTIHIERDSSLIEYLENFVKSHAPNYTGLMNFETIGGLIIEAHLRFADQWCDLYGANWMHAVVELYKSGHWHFSDHEKIGYSIPLFGDENYQFETPSYDQQSRIRAWPDVSSLQITFDPAKSNSDHARPPGGFRLALINAWQLSAGLDALDEIAREFPSEYLIRPASIPV